MGCSTGTKGSKQDMKDSEVVCATSGAGWKKWKTLAIVGIACVLCLGPGKAQAQRGAITLPRNLSDITSMADRIIQGRVESARVEPAPDYKNLKTLLITLRVDDVLKGASVKTLTFREFIWDVRDISDAAGYHVGDEVVLFLNHPTSLGLVSPVALEQGRFRVMKDRTGTYQAVNGSGNAGLFKNLVESGALDLSKLSAPSQSALRGFKQGAIPLNALKESTRALLRQPMRSR